MLRESESVSTRTSNPRTADFRSQNLRAERRRKFFRIVAKHAYPRQTVPEVRALTGYPERTIYDWLAGESDVPWPVLIQLMGEIARE